jgi:molybdopterin converting factor small subunit
VTLRLTKKFQNESESIQKRAGVLHSELEDYASAVQGAIDDLREEYDEKSESWQASERGEAASEWLNSFEELLETIETAQDGLLAFADFPIEEKPE